MDTIYKEQIYLFAQSNKTQRISSDFMKSINKLDSNLNY